jgi:hypothetical protein
MRDGIHGEIRKPALLRNPTTSACRPTGRRAPRALQIALNDPKELLSPIFVEGVRLGAASLVA